MAYPLNRTLIACSVSALALAIVSLYYWQLKKRRKSDTAIEAQSSSSRVDQISNEVEEEHSLDSSCSPSTSFVDSSESNLFTSVGVEEIEQEKEIDFIENSGHDQSTETNQSSINLDSVIDIGKDDTETKIVCTQSTSLLMSEEVNQITDLEQHLIEENSSIDSEIANISIPVSQEKQEVLDLKQTNQSANEMHLNNVTPPIVSNSGVDEKLADAIKLNLSLKEESAACHDQVSSIDPESAKIAKTDSIFVAELSLNTEKDSSLANGDENLKEPIKEETVAKTCEPDLLKESSAVHSDEVIENHFNHLNDDGKSIEESNVSIQTQDSIEQNTKAKPETPAANIKKRPPKVYQNVKPGQTFAQVLAAKKAESMKPMQNAPLDISTEQPNGSIGNLKEETDLYGFSDSARASSEGQCSPNSECYDVHSQGSNDSGKGGSDILHGDQASSSLYNIANCSDDQIICYQFEMPHYLCGKLIGAGGHYINTVKQKSNTQIVINPHYFNSEFKICSITGTKSNVNNALYIIRRRFPIRDYPNVTLLQCNVISPVPTIPLTQACRLQLPTDILTDVILSCTINAGHFFLQQPTHPSYPQLNQLDHMMKLNYSQANAPPLPHIQPSLICAAPTAEGWFRALIMNVHESNSECDIMFVDYGGYAYNVPVYNLRQIRYDFVSLPFQATECYLNNVVPVDAENGWSIEANNVFEQLAQGQIIYAQIKGHAENGTPLVDLFRVHGSEKACINKELVERGFGLWMQIPS